MSYGLKVYNTNNEVQIDSTYRNFSLTESGTWSASSGFNGFSFASTYLHPIVALQFSSVDYSFISGWDWVSGELNFAGIDIFAASALDLPYLIFTESDPSEIPTDSYGLAIYNTNGDLVFHNFNKWMRIISAQTINNPFALDCSGDSSNFPIDVTVNDADNNYFIFTPVCGVGEYYPPTDNYGDVTPKAGSGVMKVDSVTLRIDFVTTEEVDGDDSFCCGSDYFSIIEVNT